METVTVVLELDETLVKAIDAVVSSVRETAKADGVPAPTREEVIAAVLRNRFFVPNES